MSIVDPYLLHQQKNGTRSGCNRFRDNTPCYLYSVHTRSGVSMLRAWLRAITPHPGEKKPVFYIPRESAVIVSEVTAELDRSWYWCCYCSKSSWHSTTAWWLSRGRLCTGGRRGARWWFRTDTRLIVYSQVCVRISCYNQSEVESYVWSITTYKTNTFKNNMTYLKMVTPVIFQIINNYNPRYSAISTAN